MNNIGQRSVWTLPSDDEMPTRGKCPWSIGGGRRTMGPSRADDTGSASVGDRSRKPRLTAKCPHGAKCPGQLVVDRLWTHVSVRSKSSAKIRPLRAASRLEKTCESRRPRHQAFRHEDDDHDEDRAEHEVPPLD